MAQTTKHTQHCIACSIASVIDSIDESDAEAFDEAMSDDEIDRLAAEWLVDGTISCHCL